MTRETLTFVRQKERNIKKQLEQFVVQFQGDLIMKLFVVTVATSMPVIFSFLFFWRLLHSARVRFAISLDRLLAHMKTFFSFIFFFTFFKSLWSVLNLITNQIFIQNVLERPPTHKLPQIIPLLINLFPNK